MQIVALDRQRDPAAPWVALSEPFPLALGDGDSLVAIADETGTVNVIVTTRTGSSWVGAAVLPEHHPLRFAGGRVGLRLAPTVTVDNFMGGDVVMAGAPSNVGRMRA